LLKKIGCTGRPDLQARRAGARRLAPRARLGKKLKARPGMRPSISTALGCLLVIGALAASSRACTSFCLPHFRTVDNPTVRSLSLQSFDLSGEAPLLMLDINAKREGRVDEVFQIYDRKSGVGFAKGGHDEFAGIRRC
jgi:hypothetical protein